MKRCPLLQRPAAAIDVVALELAASEANTRHGTDSRRSARNQRPRATVSATPRDSPWNRRLAVVRHLLARCRPTADGWIYALCWMSGLKLLDNAWWVAYVHLIAGPETKMAGVGDVRFVN